MTTTTMTKQRTVRAFTKAVDEETREVEQIVSVFENVDLGKDRVKAGAFDGSIARWAASGDPVPAIWSHMWDDPFAHIGYAVEVKELLPGDDLLPVEISDLGGLYVKYVVDEAPFAEQVFSLLKGRRVREASFAYDVIREKRNADGTTDLLELDLIEIGPTLKGMNPMTQLLSAKSAQAAREAFVDGVVAKLRDLGVDDDVTEQLATEAKASSHTFLPKDDEPERCSICNLTRNTLGHLNLLAAGPGDTKDRPAVEAKAMVELPGSLEQVLDTYFRAAIDYAAGENIGLGGFYALHPEATYPDEQRAVYLVEGWDDPWGEGAYFEFRYTTDDEGDLVVEEASEVVIEGVVRPKARRKAAARAARDGKPPAPSTEAKGMTPSAALVELGAIELDIVTP